MKKKVWNITVKDNPNTVDMGENDDFYTTDTEAYLVFNLQDKFFRPRTATLTLENRNDGSLKSEEVEVVDGVIEWEIPRRYIEHFGNWQGQLVYEDAKDGQPELYTSTPFTFVVNAHIGDKKQPSLVEIENWENFTREATELIETWEDLEDLRQANEQQRESAELSRQNEFETNEDERENTFEINESTRQANESARETAESVRVANEEERITKDSERDSKIEAVEDAVEDVSGELDSKANKKQADWITPTLLNGAEDTPAQPVRFMKDEFGFVHINGRVTNAVLREHIFTLPQGYRPDFSMSMVGNGEGGSHVLISIAASTGNVSALSGSLTYITLDGISFYAGGD